MDLNNLNMGVSEKLGIEVTFFLSAADISRIKELFSEKEQPGFTVLREHPMYDTDLIQIAIYFETSLHMWFMIQSVYIKEKMEGEDKKYQDWLKSIKK